MAAKVSFKSNWSDDQIRMIDVGVLEMATDIDRKAKMLAPRDQGNLISSGRIKRNGLGNYSVIFGGSGSGFSVPYAKRRHFENLKSPGTLKYLTRASEAVSRGSIKKYFRGI